MSEYTREEIQSMTEPQLQIEAAKFLGWEKLFIHGLETVWYVDKTGRNHPNPPPADWETAGAITEALISKFSLSDYKQAVELFYTQADRKWFCMINNKKQSITGEDKTAFKAVVRAALMVNL